MPKVGGRRVNLINFKNILFRKKHVLMKVEKRNLQQTFQDV